jgi:hypothetical protein
MSHPQLFDALRFMFSGCYSYEAMHMIRKGQLGGITKGDVLAQNQVINQLFGLAA